MLAHKENKKQLTELKVTVNPLALLGRNSIANVVLQYIMKLFNCDLHAHEYIPYHSQIFAAVFIFAVFIFAFIIFAFSKQKRISRSFYFRALEENVI